MIVSVNGNGQESENGIATEFVILESVTSIVATTGKHEPQIISDSQLTFKDAGLGHHLTETDERELPPEGRHLEDLVGAALIVHARDPQADGVLIDTSRIGESLPPESQGSRLQSPLSQHPEDRHLAQVPFGLGHHQLCLEKILPTTPACQGPHLPETLPDP